MAPHEGSPTWETQNDAPLQPGAPIGHQQQTQDDVRGAADVQPDESALAKKIEQENEWLDRELRGIRRGENPWIAPIRIFGPSN
jgi:hypothetical protein